MDSGLKITGEQGKNQETHCKSPRRGVAKREMDREKEKKSSLAGLNRVLFMVFLALNNLVRNFEVPNILIF